MDTSGTIDPMSILNNAAALIVGAVGVVIGIAAVVILAIELVHRDRSLPRLISTAFFIIIGAALALNPGGFVELGRGIGQRLGF